MPIKYTSVLLDIYEYLSGAYLNSVLVTNTDQNEILNIVHALKCIESKGVEDISQKFLKMKLQPFWTRSSASWPVPE